MISHSMSDQAKGLACTDPGAWTPSGMSENTMIDLQLICLHNSHIILDHALLIKHCDVLISLLD